MNKIVWYVSLFFILIALVPDAVMILFNVPFFFVTILNLGGVLIVVGVFSDTVEQINIQMNVQENNCNALCLIANDEIEADIKKTFLESKGITCFVKPYRFTWGIPIRTALDSYNLMVSKDKVDEAFMILRK